MTNKSSRRTATVPYLFIQRFMRLIPLGQRRIQRSGRSSANGCPLGSIEYRKTRSAAYRQASPLAGLFVSATLPLLLRCGRPIRPCTGVHRMRFTLHSPGHRRVRGVTPTRLPDLAGRTRFDPLPHPCGNLHSTTSTRTLAASFPGTTADSPSRPSTAGRHRQLSSREIAKFLLRSRASATVQFLLLSEYRGWQ
jgi:hypothetical protein